jgi:hypothetical protein
MALKSLEESKEVEILQADKVKFMIILIESLYKEMSSLLEPGVLQIEKMRMTLTKNKTHIHSCWKHELTAYHNKPKVRKPDTNS